MAGDSGAEGCCIEGRASVGCGPGVLSRSILGREVASGVPAVSEKVTEEANEAPRGGTIKGEGADIWD